MGSISGQGIQIPQGETTKTNQNSLLINSDSPVPPNPHSHHQPQTTNLLACSGHFTLTEFFNMWSFVANFFKNRMFLRFILEKKWKWKSLSRVQLCDPMDYTVPGILQARILEWVAFPFSRGSSWPRNWTGVSCIAVGFFTSWAQFLLTFWWYVHDTKFTILIILKKVPVPSPTLVIVYLSLNYNSPSGYEVLSHDFDLHFSDDSWCSPSFLMRFVVFNICFTEMSTLILCPYLSLYYWVCKSSLYILDTSPLSGIWFIIFPIL